MGLMKKTNLFAVLAMVAIGFAFTACGKSDGGSTVAAVPVNQCVQPGAISPYGQPILGQPGYGQPGYGQYPQQQYGYGNPAPFQPYNYQGQGCGATGVPTCYPNGGGLQCLPQSMYQNFYQQGYNPMMYGYQNQMNKYGYQGFPTYGGIQFSFQYNVGAGGYAPNRYVQGCNVNSFLNSCGYGAVCRPINYNGLGICARAY